MQVPSNHPSKSVSSPVVKINIFRIGDVEAMVDSGAKNSVISEELLSGRASFPIRPSSPYRNIDGSAVGNVLGEVSIKVWYGGSVVDLNRVKNLVFPVVLGIEWIVQSGVTIKGVNGRAEVRIPEQDETIDRGGPKVQLSEAGRALDEEKLAVPTSSEFETVPEQDILRKIQESTTVAEKLACIKEEEEDEVHSNVFPKEAEGQRVMAALIDEASYNVSVRPKRFLKPMRSKRVPAGSWGLISCKVFNENHSLWMVSAASAWMGGNRSQRERDRTDKGS